MTRKTWLGVASVALLALGAGGSSLAMASCAQTPTNVPLRSFERAQKVDIVCMQVLDQNGNAQFPVPVAQESCGPVPAGVVGSTLTFHLYALVTQTTRGEVAVVDLTAGNVVDEDRSTPGINFLPVGQLPTGVAVAPDGQLAFVAAAEVNKPAIYGIQSFRILGDSQGLGLPPGGPLTLTSWPACALPQSPGSITVIPMPAASDAGAGEAEAGPDAGPADAGASDGEAGDLEAGDGEAGEAGTGDAGTTDAESDAAAESGAGFGGAAGYVVAVVLPGNERDQPAAVVTIDPGPFLRGGGIPDAGTGSAIEPGGALPLCPILSVTELAGAFVPPTGSGPAWDDGVKYVEGGVDLRDAGLVIPEPPDAGSGDAGDAGNVDAGVFDAAPYIKTLVPPPAPSCAGMDGSAPVLDAGPTPPQQPHASAAVRDGQTLYVADDAIPLIHVLDLSNPLAPRELLPLLATSQLEPSRIVAVGDLAVSPPTSEYKRFLYAIDKKDNPASIIIYDITDTATSPRVPLTRPHPELNPLQPIDRIQFSVPVAALSFVRHDFPLSSNASGPISGAVQTGLICNPNPNASADGGAPDPGANYNAASGVVPGPVLGPARLRGIFAFATLSNGQLATIDVDDWDAPCRRPIDMSGGTSSIAPAEPTASAMDAGAYAAPLAGADGGVSLVTAEAYFPVSAPHRSRSIYFLRNDPQTGTHIPNLQGAPQLQLLSSALPTTGTGSDPNPLMLPTKAGFADPEASLTGPAVLGSPGLLFAWEDPQTQIDQNWTITYEGVLGAYDGIPATIGTGDGYESANLNVPNGLLCRNGVEDWDAAHQRAVSFEAAVSKPPPRLEWWTGDYVQLADDLLGPTDPYWNEDPIIPDAGADGGVAPSSCWDGLTADGSTLGKGVPRYNYCTATFGSAADQSLQRDFPILQAYDDHFTVTRFNYGGPSPTFADREITPPDPSNVQFLKALDCCFHHQVNFHVRTGGEWSAVGSISAFLHHMVSDPATGRCVTSCDPDKSLLNGRLIGVPPPSGMNGVRPAVLDSENPDRVDPRALYNPMFSLWMRDGVGADMMHVNQPLKPARDTQWQFATRGQFTPLTINIATSTSAVSPQSMLFIESLGQLAVVDGAAQGLVLVDLNNVAVAGTPYF